MAGMRKLAAILLTTSIITAGPGCAAGTPYVELKGSKFRVEIADEPEEQTLGLMFRTSLADDKGMLFIFSNEAPRSFWMRNTRIPLDILYFSSQLKLVSMVENAKPCRTRTCPAYPSAGPAMYVLELNAGKAAELDVAPGDVLVLHLD